MLKLDRKKSKLLTTFKIIGFAGIMAFASPIKAHAEEMTEEEKLIEILRTTDNSLYTDEEKEEMIEILTRMSENRKEMNKEIGSLKEDMVEFDKEFTEDLNELESEIEGLSTEIHTSFDEIYNNIDELKIELDKTTKELKRDLIITEIILGVGAIVSVGALGFSIKRLVDLETNEDIKVLEKTYE